MAGKVITDFIRMQLFKKGGAIANDKAVQFSANALEKRLINLGVDPNSINNQTQLKQLLAYVKQAEDQQFNQLFSNVLSGDEAATFLNKAFPKKGEVFDLQGNKLNPKKPIMGGTQGIEELLKKGDVTKGTVSKKSNKVVEREMFEEANKKFNKTDIVADSVARITSMEPVAAMKEANKIIGRKGIYKNLDETQSKKILQDTEDWIFQRDPADLYDYKKNRPFRDDPNFDPDDPDFDPEQGFYTGGMVDVEPNLSDIGHGSDALMARTRLVSPDGQATTSTGLNYLLAEDNDNIRVPFGNGKKVYDYNSFDHKINELKAHYKRYLKGLGGRKGGVMTFEQFAPLFAAENFAEGGRIGFQGGGMGRRAFLKLMAALTGGVAAAKSGILGLGSKEAGKQAAKEVIKSAGSGQPPPYFFKLVEKIKTLGDDVTKKSATQEREVVTKYKDFELTENIATGEQTIQKIKTDGPEYYDETLAEEIYMNYKPGKGLADEGTKGIPADEYVEDTGYLRTTGPDKGELFDSTDGLTNDSFKEIMEEIGEVVIKKASGGRIGFSGGNLAKLLADKTITGSSRKFLEKVFGKQNLETMVKRDPEMHRGLLEVVEMFRNRDKEGLKIYMQKFLPHMDDAQIEEFIIGGSGIDDMSGQLIRLGSGRDYKAKIDMIKEADNVRKLDNLDVTEEMIRKPNANGGIITMLGE